MSGVFSRFAALWRDPKSRRDFADAARAAVIVAGTMALATAAFCAAFGAGDD